MTVRQMIVGVAIGALAFGAMWHRIPEARGLKVITKEKPVKTVKAVKTVRAPKNLHIEPTSHRRKRSDIKVTSTRLY
jgi:hypothetical protein